MRIRINRNIFQYLVSCLIDSDQSEQEYLSVCVGFISVVSKDAAEINESTCQTVQSIFEYLFKGKKLQ